MKIQFYLQIQKVLCFKLLLENEIIKNNLNFVLHFRQIRIIELVKTILGQYEAIFIFMVYFFKFLDQCI